VAVIAAADRYDVATARDRVVVRGRIGGQCSGREQE